MARGSTVKISHSMCLPTLLTCALVTPRIRINHAEQVKGATRNWSRVVSL